MRRVVIVFAALSVFVVSCSPAPSGLSEPSTSLPPPDSTSPSPSTTPPPTAGAITSGDLDVIVVADDDGALPDDLIVSCPSGPEFPFGALNEISALQGNDPDGLLDAIEPFLQNEEGQFWPQDGWSLLHQDAESSTLVAPTEEGHLAFMYLAQSDGTWTWAGSSLGGDPCDIQYLVPDDLHTVVWELDSSRSAPTVDSTELHVLLTERDCASGLEIGDRLVGPHIVMTEDTVHIAFAAEPPPGDAQTCPGIAPAPYTVSLPQPLGEREVVTAMNTGYTLEEFLD